jgi:hypothetical protein
LPATVVADLGQTISEFGTVAFSAGLTAGTSITETGGSPLTQPMRMQPTGKTSSGILVSSKTPSVDNGTWLVQLPGVPSAGPLGTVNAGSLTSTQRTDTDQISVLLSLALSDARQADLNFDELVNGIADSLSPAKSNLSSAKAAEIYFLAYNGGRKQRIASYL